MTLADDYKAGSESFRTGDEEPPAAANDARALEYLRGWKAARFFAETPTDDYKAGIKSFHNGDEMPPAAADDPRALEYLRGWKATRFFTSAKETTARAEHPAGKGEQA